MYSRKCVPFPGLKTQNGSSVQIEKPGKGKLGKFVHYFIKVFAKIRKTETWKVHTLRVTGLTSHEKISVRKSHDSVPFYYSISETSEQ